MILISEKQKERKMSDYKDEKEKQRNGEVEKGIEEERDTKRQKGSGQLLIFNRRVPPSLIKAPHQP